MSPPNSTPQHDAAQDSNAEAKLEKVDDQQDVATMNESAPLSGQATDPTDLADDTNTTTGAGQPVETKAQDEGHVSKEGSSEMVEKVHETPEESKATPAGAEVDQSKDMEAVQTSSTAPIEELTTKTETVALDRASTPPHELSEKSAGKAPIRSPSPPPPPPKDDR